MKNKQLLYIGLGGLGLFLIYKLVNKNQENEWVLFDFERNYTLHANNEQEDQELFKSFQLLQAK